MNFEAKYHHFVQGHQYPGQPSPRTGSFQPKRIEFHPEFDDEWKKIGSKRQKFEDLGLPLPEAANKHKMLFVKEAEKESRLKRVNQSRRIKLPRKARNPNFDFQGEM